MTITQTYTCPPVGFTLLEVLFIVLDAVIILAPLIVIISWDWGYIEGYKDGEQTKLK